MKHLYRSTSDKKIAGVCGGFSHYFAIDPSLVRIVWLSTLLLGGTGLILYLICWIIMPKNHTPPVVIDVTRKVSRSSQNKIIAGVCGGLGNYFDVDPILIRILFLFMVLGLGWGILLYVILWIVLPLNSSE